MKQIRFILLVSGYLVSPAYVLCPLTCSLWLPYLKVVASSCKINSKFNSNIISLLQNFNGSRHPSGMELVPGFMNGMYPSNTMFSQYGNTFRASSRYGSSAYTSRTGSVDNKFRAAGNGYVNDSRKNVDGFSELNKGPRAAKSSDIKSVKSLGPVTLLLKGQNLPAKTDDKEVPVVPNKEQYNGEDLSENYSDAKFFVIKSYSEDDVHKSIKYSVWASTPNGNKKLDAAYQEAKEKPGGCPIFLLFSVSIKCHIHLMNS